MKKILVAALALLALVGGAVAAGNADMEWKYSGPSGQGDLILWCPTNGTTSVVFKATGAYFPQLYLDGTAVVSTNMVGAALAAGDAGGLTNIPAAQLKGNAPIAVMTNVWPSMAVATGLMAKAVSTAVVTNWGIGYTNRTYYVGGIFSSNSYNAP